MAECVMEQRQERKEEGRQGEGRGEGKPAQALILSAPPPLSGTTLGPDLPPLADDLEYPQRSIPKCT